MRHPQPKYEPTEIDKAWAQGMINLINDGGVLAMPSSMLIYMVSHKNKTLTLVNPEILLVVFESFVTHMQTVATFDSIGYKVTPKD